MMKNLLVEVILDYAMMHSRTATVKAAIIDGSSLLYDLMPSYVGFNLGQSGLATRHRIREFKLVRKQGQCLGDKEYVVSLFRHSANPHVFMVMAFDMIYGGEYVLELVEQDIFQLIEGD